MNPSDLLIHTASVLKQSVTKDAVGGIKRVFTIRLQGIACRRQMLAASKIAEFRRNQMDVTGKVYFNGSPGLHVGDRLDIKNQRGALLGGRLEVMGFRDCDELGVLAVADIREVQDS